MNVYLVYCVSDLDPPNLDKSDLLETLYDVLSRAPLAFASLPGALAFCEADAHRYVDEAVANTFDSDETAPDEDLDKTVIWQIESHVVRRGKLRHRDDVEWFALVHEVTIRGGDT